MKYFRTANLIWVFVLNACASPTRTVANVQENSARGPAGQHSPEDKDTKEAPLTIGDYFQKVGSPINFPNSANAIWQPGTVEGEKVLKYLENGLIFGANKSGLTFEDAINFCSTLKPKDFWRLPTSKQLRSVLRNLEFTEFKLIKNDLTVFTSDQGYQYQKHTYYLSAQDESEKWGFTENTSSPDSKNFRSMERRSKSAISTDVGTDYAVLCVAGP